MLQWTWKAVNKKVKGTDCLGILSRGGIQYYLRRLPQSCFVGASLSLSLSLFFFFVKIVTAPLLTAGKVKNLPVFVLKVR